MCLGKSEQHLWVAIEDVSEGGASIAGEHDSSLEGIGVELEGLGNPFKFSKEKGKGFQWDHGKVVIHNGQEVGGASFVFVKGYVDCQV